VNYYLLLPIAFVAIGATSSGALRRRLPPRHATRILAVTAVGTALAVIWATLSLLVSSLGHPGWLADVAGWCHHLYRSEATGQPMASALAAVALLAVSTGVVRASLRERRAFRAVPAGTGPISLIDSAVPFAYAVPGRLGHAGRIIVSSFLFESLDVDERCALLAHERAHLRHHHHRYRMAADLAAAALPPLRPAARHVRFASERWADEEAVEAVRDRRLVARAIARAAVLGHQAGPSSRLALAESGVVARVEALLHPPRKRRTSDSIALLSGMAALTMTVLGSTVQLHHLLALALHACTLH